MPPRLPVLVFLRGSENGDLNIHNRASSIEENGTYSLCRTASMKATGGRYPCSSM